jgi:RNA methyltransferase, TrmH family
MGCLVATPLGHHAERLRSVRTLRSVKGRRERQRFAFEGETLLGEAIAARYPIDEVYATAAAYELTPALQELDAQGTPVFVVPPAAAAAISDLKTPNGILAVAPIRLEPAGTVFGRGGVTVVLADLNDPANAGTLLRSADAFGCLGVVFGRLGVDPYHPKVVRGSMGAIFRLPIGLADAMQVHQAAVTAGVRTLGLAATGPPLTGTSWQPPLALVVGNERHGLGSWEEVCEALAAIPMTGRAESLSAAVAGSIALYEAQKSLR